MGPPASASGPMWPMQAPVETPEKRASVRTAICLPKLRCLRARGDLVDFLHAGPHRSPANQHENVAGLEAVACPLLMACDGGPFGQEDAGRADLAIDAVGIDDARIDGGALDDGAFRSEVAAWESDGGGQAALAGLGRAHDDIVGIDAVVLDTGFHVHAFGVRIAATSRECGQAFAGDGEDRFIEQAELAQVQHDFGDAARQEDAHGRMADGPVGQAIDQARRLGVDGLPILDRGPTSGPRNGRRRGCAAADSSSRRTPRVRSWRCETRHR